MPRGTGSATAEAPSEPAQGASEEKTATQVAEERAEAAEARAGTAEAALGRINERFDALEARLRETPAPVPIGESPSEEGVRDPNAFRRRAFVCPQKPNWEVLIKVGKVRQVRDPNSPTGYRDHDREGDVKIKFEGGRWMSAAEGAPEQILIDDKARIAWCEANPKTVRDVMEPTTPVWFEIKKGQIATSRSDPSFSSSVDVDAALVGDVSKLAGEGGSVVQDTRTELETVNRRA